MIFYKIFILNNDSVIIVNIFLLDRLFKLVIYFRYGDKFLIIDYDFKIILFNYDLVIG